MSRPLIRAILVIQAPHGGFGGLAQFATDVSAEEAGEELRHEGDDHESSP